MIIEFAGPSCAGKTTMIRSLSNELARRGFPVNAVCAWQATPMQVARGLFDPRLLAWAIMNAKMIGRWSKMVGAIEQARRLKRDPAVVLLDEGPVKCQARGLRKSKASGLLHEAMPSPDILVIVTCDPLVRLARLRREKRPHVENRTDEQILGGVTGDLFARSFAAKRNVPMIEIDTTAPGDHLGTLWKQLEPLLPTTAES